MSTQPATTAATSDIQGNFTIANVAPGSYAVSAARTGYQTGSVNVSVVAGQTAIATVSLLAAALPFTYTQVAQFQGTGTSAGNGLASIAISPDGRLIAYGSFVDNLVHIVDVTTRQELRTFSGHTNRVTELVFSPDSRLLATTGTVNLPPGDGSVKIWDVTTGTQLATTATPGTRQLRRSRGCDQGVRVVETAGSRTAGPLGTAFQYSDPPDRYGAFIAMLVPFTTCAPVGVLYVASTVPTIMPLLSTDAVRTVTMTPFRRMLSYSAD